MTKFGLPSMIRMIPGLSEQSGPFIGQDHRRCEPVIVLQALLNPPGAMFVMGMGSMREGERARESIDTLKEMGANSPK